MRRAISKKSPFLLCLLASLLAPGAARADIYKDDLARCVAKSATTGDREILLRWMFGMMATNPKIKDMAQISDAQADALNKDTATVFQRLMLTNCRNETGNAIKYEGVNAIADAFEIMGRMAMTELMGGEATTAYTDRMDRYLDQAKWEAFNKENGLPSSKAAKSTPAN